MSSTILTVVFGLAASLLWGSGDFCGGLASRRDNPSSVVMAAYGAGLVLLVVIALVWREPFPQPVDILWGAIASVAGTIGLITFYSALSTGRMGIIAPVSAILTAALPVLFGIFTQGLPSGIQLGGFILALVAVGLISRPEQRLKGRPEGLGLALIAGLGFGCFFILISRVSPGATFWPLAIARLTSMILLLVLLGVRRQRILPGKGATTLVLLTGGLDALGNAFFVLATHIGRLDVAAILSALYPAATVVLATIVLRERVTRVQAIGILLALVAIPLISTKF